MESKFAKFLNDQNIDRRRVLAASRQIERLRPEDRAIKLAQRKGGEAASAGDDKKSAKPRSGRPVTDQLLRAADEGKPVPGPAKQRLLRAVNRILEQKSKDPVDLRTLF